jgi:hypothetical protein
VLPGATKMRALLASYLNDIVSLIVMALMAIALIAGQAGAVQHAAAKPADSIGQVIMIDTNLSIRQDSE